MPRSSQATRSIVMKLSTSATDLGRVCAMLAVPFYRLFLLPAAPVAGPASVMGKRDHPELFATDIVNDAVREFPQREAVSTIPRRAKMGWPHRNAGALSYSR